MLRRHYVVIKNDGVIQAIHGYTIKALKRTIEEMEAILDSGVYAIGTGQFSVMTRCGLKDIEPWPSPYIYRAYGPFWSNAKAGEAAARLRAIAGDKPDNRYRYIVLGAYWYEADYIKEEKKLGKQELADENQWPQLPIFYEGTHKDKADFGKILDCGTRLPLRFP